MEFAHITTKEALAAYLNQLNIAVLSTVSSDGAPYAAVIYFVVDHDLNFYFLTLSDTKKAKNLQENKNTALTTIDLPSMITVQTTGMVQEVTDPQQYTYMVKKIGEANARKNKSQWPPPISKLHSMGNIVVYKYTPKWLRIGDYSQKVSPDDQATERKSVFTQIIPNQESNS